MAPQTCTAYAEVAYAEVGIECCSKLMTVGEALIHAAHQHGPVHIVVQQLDAANEPAGLISQLLHESLHLVVMRLLQLHQAGSNLADVLLQVGKDGVSNLLTTSGCLPTSNLLLLCSASATSKYACKAAAMLGV